MTGETFVDEKRDSITQSPASPTDTHVSDDRTVQGETVVEIRHASSEVADSVISSFDVEQQRKSLCSFSRFPNCECDAAWCVLFKRHDLSVNITQCGQMTAKAFPSLVKSGRIAFSFVAGLEQHPGIATQYAERLREPDTRPVAQHLLLRVSISASFVTSF
jgi:hypothetical protein